MLKIQELRAENFSKYGTFLNPLECGEPLGASQDDPVRFYPDRIVLTFAASNVLAFSPIAINPRPFLITDIEYHEFTEELIGALRKTSVSALLPQGVDLSKIEVFKLPAGWWVRFNAAYGTKPPMCWETAQLLASWVCRPTHTRLTATWLI